MAPWLHAQDPYGLVDLRNRYGASLPEGAGTVGWQTEAAVNTSVAGQVWTSYWPDLNSPTIVSGRTQFTLYGPPTQISPAPPPALPYPNLTQFSSAHATVVGSYWYGAAGVGVAPDLSHIVSTSAGYFLNSAALRVLDDTTAPVIDLAIPRPDVVNASWIGAYPEAPINVDVLRRADYLVDRLGVNLVVGVDNGPVTPTALLGQGYNSIAVGRSDGGSAGGLSTVDGAGRVLIDVVVPLTATSYAAPVVAGTATLIVDRAQETPALANAADPRVVRSLIMTGAEKLPGWANSPTQPVDLFQGAGELRINRTYDILMAGEVGVGSVSTLRGWDLGETDGTVQYYFVDNPMASGHLSVTLTWNRVTGDPNDPLGQDPGGSGNFTLLTDPGTMTDYTVLAASPLADLGLEVLTADGSNTPLTSLAASQSQNDNVEHIFLRDLTAGRYAIAVTGLSGTGYALSFSFVPETRVVGPLVLLALVTGGWLHRRNRRAAGGGN